MLIPLLFLGGPDTGKWNIRNVGRDAGHEFGHLLGVDDHEGQFFMDTHPRHRPSPGTATAYDYGWAFGGAIKDHRNESRPTVYIPYRDLYRFSGVATRAQKGAPSSHRSTTELRAARFWWR